MKHQKKGLALCLLVCMLLTMLPMGLFSVGATGTEIVIDNIDEWEEYAETNETFAGKTVKLGGDIDAKGGTLPTLASTFEGNFDGQEFTIKNATMTGAGVIANTITASTDVTIQNLRIEGVTVNNAAGAAGAIAGTLSGTDANVTFKRISVVGTSVTGMDNAGGLIGAVNVTTANGNSTVTVQQVSVEATVTATTRAGGLFGYDSSKGFNETKPVTLTVEDSYFNSSITAATSSGLIGVYKGGNSNNGGGVLANAKNSAYFDMKNLVVGGGTTYKVISIGGGVFTYENLYLLNTTGTLFGATSYGSWINGMLTNLLGENNYRSVITVDTLTAAGAVPPSAISAADAAAYFPRNEKGFISIDIIEISSAAEWNAVASTSNNNWGKRVMLTADINEGATPLLTLFDTFTGSFDGQGHTITFGSTGRALLANTSTLGVVIKDVKFNGTLTDSANADEAGMLIAHHDGTGSVTVDNVMVSGSVTSGAMHVGGLFGSLTLNDGFAANFTNIQMNANVTNTRETNTHAAIGTGGVIGNFEPIGKPTLTICSVNVAGNVTSAATSVGGVIGSVFSRDAEENLYAGGTITIANGTVTGALSSSVAKELVGVGGIVGTFGGFFGEYDEVCAFDGTLNINNCLVSGSIANTNTELSRPSSVGGVIGSMSYSHATVNVDHCQITATFASQSLSETNGTGAGLILGTGGCQTMSALNVNNSVTTHANFVLVGSALDPSSARDNGTWIVLNGKNCASIAATNKMTDTNGKQWKYSNALNDNSVVTVSVAAATSMIKKNETTGFVTRIGGQITALGIQDNVRDRTLTSADTYSIRFIGISHVDQIASAKMTVIVRNTATGEAFKKYEAECKLYDALYAYNANGSYINSYTATDFGAKKFLALTINNIPAGTAYTFEFTPSYTMTNGAKATAETVSVSYDATGKYVKELESIDVEPLVLAPTIRVMSSNIIVAQNDSFDPSTGEGINGNLGGGLTHSQRAENMSNMFLFYQPDFIGLQEVYNKDNVYNMFKAVMSRVGDKYDSVDYSDQFTAIHATPILYLKDKWTLLDYKIESMSATEYCCNTHIWQWARFESKEDPDVKVIMMNLHGPTNAHGEWLSNHTGGDGSWFEGKEIFFGAVNEQIKALEAKYPDEAIMITGDFNINMSNPLFSTMVDGTRLKNSADITSNNERVWTDLDHVWVSYDKVTVEQQRILSDKHAVGISTDHPIAFADITLRRERTYGSSMDWDDGESF